MCLFAGCKKEDNMNTYNQLGGFVIDNSISFASYESKEYAIETLKNYFGIYSSQERSSFGIYTDEDKLDINNVNKYFPIDFIRQNENSFYSMYKVKEGGIYYVFWSVNLENVVALQSVYINKLKTESDFDSIEIGRSTCEDVFKIDPATELVLILSNGTYSYNRLENNQLLEIEYSFEKHQGREDLIVKSKEIVPNKGHCIAYISNILLNDLP